MEQEMKQEMEQGINLDYLCAENGQEIGGIADKNTLQKALGVIKEDGIYAMFLYLEKENNKIREKLCGLLNKQGIKEYLLGKDFSVDFKNFCNELSEVLENIDKLFFIKKILERTLTYAFYHSKIEKR